MQTFEIERTRTNAEALDAEIRSELGEAFLGLSTEPGKVVLHFADEATGTQMQNARDKAVLHDADVLSPRQEAEEARRQVIINSRERLKNSLDVSQFTGETNPVKDLAERVAWLEAEIRDLRGL